MEPNAVQVEPNIVYFRQIGCRASLERHGRHRLAGLDMIRY